MSHSNTVRLSLSIKIDLTQEEIFNAATNWEGQSRWIYLTKVIPTDSTPNQVGKKLEAFTGLFGIGFLDTMTVELWDPPSTCIVVHTGKVVKGKGIFGASSINNSKYFVWTEEIILPLGLLGRVGWVFVKPLSALGLWASLRRFKRYAESGALHEGPSVVT